MSIPALASAARAGYSAAWGTLNAPTAYPIFARLPAAAVTPNWSDVWPGASLTTAIPLVTLPTAAFTMGVVSDSANDTNTTGSGAWIVQVQGVDSNYNPVTANVVLNGQSIVTSVSMMRINSAQVIASASGNTANNAGNIYIVDSSTSVTGGIPSTTAKVFDVIPVGFNTDGLGVYTVPAGVQAELLHFNSGVTNGTATSYEGRVRVGVALWNGGPPPNGSLLPFQYAVVTSPSTVTPNDDFRFDLPPIFPPGSVIRFQGSSTPLGAELAITAELLLSTYPGITAQGVQ